MRDALELRCTGIFANVPTRNRDCRLWSKNRAVAACTWIGSSTRRWSHKSSIPTSYAPMSGPRRVGYHGPKTQRDPSGTFKVTGRPVRDDSRCGLALVQSPAFISELHYAHNSDSADARALCSGVPPARAGHPPSPPWCQCDRWAN